MKFRALEEQVDRNRESRNRWIEYSSHRARVTQLIARHAPRDGRLLLLGAGNCNDVDLHALAGSFSEIHLVDSDSDALRWGIEQQGLSASSQLFLHGGIDVTGISENCSNWDPGLPADDEQVRQALNSARKFNLPDFLRAFDAAASIGLLSQLIEMIFSSLGELHPRFLELMAAIRLRHMQILMESVRPGGRVFLVSEIVSSSTCPELSQVSEADLPGFLIQCINARNFFTGLNPAVLESMWRSRPELAPLVEQVEQSRPWLWNFGPRIYACCTLSGTRTAKAVE